MLTAERTALNFLQRLCGIATGTRDFVDASSGRITVLDTRETMPTLRALEKYAVRVAGGVNHRVGLDDVDAALEAGVMTVKVDGLPIDAVREAVRRSRGRAKVEVSGPVPLDRMAELAQTGAEYVSIAQLTQAVTPIEMTFELASDVAPQTGAQRR